MIHLLAEKVSVAVVSVPHIRHILDAARYVPGIPVEVLNALVEALKVLRDVELACGQAVPLFDRLRRVV